MADDTLVATIRAVMIYIALFHNRLLLKIRSSDRQIDILVNVMESMVIGTPMFSNFKAKAICSGDR